MWTASAPIRGSRPSSPRPRPASPIRRRYLPRRNPLPVRELRRVMTATTAFLFDLDGTLVDSVYNHVRAWHLALREEGIDLSVWRIHRKIGMSGGLFTAQLQRELGRDIDDATRDRLRDR